MSEILAFTCSVCGKEGTDPNDGRPGWASIAAFGACTEWLSDEADHPGYLLKERSPEAGGRYRLRVSYPFRAVAGEPFWAMFEPWPIALNGWDESSDADIAACGLARCLWSGAIERSEAETVIRVDVADFVPLLAIEDRFGVGTAAEGDLNLEFFKFNTDPQVVCGDISIHAANFQGDGNVFVVCRHDGGARRAILAGYWDWHEDVVFAGSRPLTDAEWSLLGGD